MSTTKYLSKSLMVTGVILAALALAGNAAAVEEAAGEEGLANGDLPVFGLALGAGLAVGLAGLATAIAQKDIGAAAVGATAEDPGFLGRGILYIAIPETIVIFGLLIAFTLAGEIANFA